MSKDPAIQKPVYSTQERPWLLFRVCLFVFIGASFFAFTFPDLRFYEEMEIWSESLQWLISISALGMGIIVVFLAHFVFSLPLNRYLVITFGVLALGVLMSYAFLPQTIEVPYGLRFTYSFDFSSRFFGVFSGILNTLTIYALFAYVPAGPRKSDKWFFVHEFIILLALFSIVFSLIKEWDLYVRFFTTNNIQSWAGAKSWTMHKNAYGRFLMIGIFAEMYLIAKKRQYARYITVVIIFIALLFSIAKMPIILSVAGVTIGGICIGISQRKASRRSFALHIAILGSLIASAIVLFLVPTEKLGPIGTIVEYIKSDASLDDGGSISARIVIWEKIWGLISLGPQSVIFGYGDAAYPRLISSAMDYWCPIGSSHNGWIEMLGRGGLIRVLCAISLVVYLVAIAIKNVRARRFTEAVPWVIFLCWMGQTITESSFFLDTSLESVLLTMLTVVPMLEKSSEQVVPSANKVHLLPGLASIISTLLPCLMTVIVAFAPTKYLIILILVWMTCELIVFVKGDPKHWHRRWFFERFTVYIIVIVFGALFPMQGALDSLALILLTILFSVAVRAIDLLMCGSPGVVDSNLENLYLALGNRRQRRDEKATLID